MDAEVEAVKLAVGVAVGPGRSALGPQVVLTVVMTAPGLAAIVFETEASVEADAAVLQILVGVEPEVVGLAG